MNRRLRRNHTPPFKAKVAVRFPHQIPLVPRNHHRRSMMKGRNDEHYEFDFFNRQSHRLDSGQHPTIS